MENFGQNIGYAVMIIIAQIIGAFLGCISSFLAQYEEGKTGKAKLTPGIANLKPHGLTID